MKSFGFLMACSSSQKQQIAVGGEDESYEGTIDREAVRTVIRHNLLWIKQCYVAELKKNPEAQGKIVVEFQIDDSGTVTDSKTLHSQFSSSSGDDTADCINRKIRDMKFPRSPAGTIAIVRYPFVFRNK